MLESSLAAVRLRLRLRRARRRRLAAAVALEHAGRGELAELVPDHVLLHEHLQELVAVVDLEGVAHELRDDRARARPGADGLLGPVLVQLLDLAVDLLVYEGTFFCAAAHRVSESKTGVSRSPSIPGRLSHVDRLRPLLVLAHLA